MNDRDRNLMRSIANCEHLLAELAALREELAGALSGAKSAMVGKDELRHQLDTSQQRLADSERRNAVLQKAVDQSIEWFERMSSADGSGHEDLANGIRRMIAIKPTESGASE